MYSKRSSYGFSCYQLLIASFPVRFGGISDVFGLIIDRDEIKHGNDILVISGQWLDKARYQDSGHSL